MPLREKFLRESSYLMPLIKQCLSARHRPQEAVLCYYSLSKEPSDIAGPPYTCFSKEKPPSFRRLRGIVTG